MKLIKSLLFWLINPGVPGFVPVFIALALGVVIISQTSTIGKRNEQIGQLQTRKAQLLDSLRAYELQVTNAKRYYDESIQKQKAELAAIQAMVGAVPAGKLPAAIDRNLSRLDSLLGQYQKRPDLSGH